MDLAFFSPTDRVRAELTLRKIAMFDVFAGRSRVGSPLRFTFINTRRNLSFGHYKTSTS